MEVHHSMSHWGGGLSRLESLATSFNMLGPLTSAQAVPRSLLARGSSLISLDLAHNQLRQLPSGFLRSLSRLTSLDLSHNQLTHHGDVKPWPVAG
ncbi:uncharacterized protein HaLaN_07750 [Haematococcus lacustris]|uniref:Uncharacterized protein n=1 Tax=Haematococcus lacustris TaxID=44745 RepID=A0A699YX53_HAELA|nr:uncharacterized protein HaLaN_07750 [Haematococcus lacustris]